MFRDVASKNNEAVVQVLLLHPEWANVALNGKTLAQTAAYVGNPLMLKLLVTKFAADPNVKDDDGDTALHFAVINNQPECVEVLLSLKSDSVTQRIQVCDVNALNKAHCTALHVAAEKHHVECVRNLLADDGCDVNLQDRYGDTALHDAITQFDDCIVDILLKRASTRYDVVNHRGFNCLHHAALKGNATAIEKIIERWNDSAEECKQDGFTPLHIAAFNGHLPAVKVLVEKGKVNIQHKTRSDHTALHMAITHAFANVVEYLVMKEAELDNNTNNPDNNINNGADMNNNNHANNNPSNTHRRRQRQPHEMLVNLALSNATPPKFLDEAPCISKVHRDITALVLGASSSLSSSSLPVNLATACFLIQHGYHYREKDGHHHRDLPHHLPRHLNRNNNGVNGVGREGNENYTKTDDDDDDDDEGRDDDGGGDGDDEDEDDIVNRILKSYKNSSDVCTKRKDVMKDLRTVFDDDNNNNNNIITNNNINTNNINAYNNSINNNNNITISNNNNNISNNTNTNSNNVTNNNNINNNNNFSNNININDNNNKFNNMSIKDINNNNDNNNIVNNDINSSDFRGSSETYNIVAGSNCSRTEAANGIDCRSSSSDMNHNDCNDSVECCICSDNTATVRFEPCGHVIVCSQCCIPVKKCLQCKVLITGKLTSEGASMARLAGKEDESRLCSICLEQKWDQVFQCGHTACGACSRSISVCHMCRKKIVLRTNVFLS